jgi:hypothetical protein
MRCANRIVARHPLASGTRRSVPQKAAIVTRLQGLAAVRNSCVAQREGGVMITKRRRLPASAHTKRPKEHPAARGRRTEMPGKSREVAPARGTAITAIAPRPRKARLSRRLGGARSARKPTR